MKKTWWMDRQVEEQSERGIGVRWIVRRCSERYCLGSVGWADGRTVWQKRLVKGLLVVPFVGRMSMKSYQEVRKGVGKNDEMELEVKREAEEKKTGKKWRVLDWEANDLHSQIVVVPVRSWT